MCWLEGQRGLRVFPPTRIKDCQRAKAGKRYRGCGSEVPAAEFKELGVR